MAEKQKYRLEVAIEKAIQEVSEIEEVKAPQVNLIARKYAPSTVYDIIDCLNEFPWVLALHAQEGRLIEDVVAASVAEFITIAMVDNLNKAATQEKANNIRSKLIIP